MRIGLIDDPRFELHLQDPRHPESPARVAGIRDALRTAGLAAKMLQLAAREATRDELLLVHAPEYISFVEECCLDAEPAVLGPDVVVSRGSWLAAQLAAGSAIEATRQVLSGGIKRAFCNIRPPGHHALPDQAMGFCIFNNVALAAKWALERGGLKRVAIVDWDVHHGNGTQDIFWDETRVLYASMHQHPFYPGTGVARKRDNLVSVPLPAGCSEKAHLEAFHTLVVPVLKAFDPELILVSCGFDAHKDDPLGQLQLTDEAYAEMTRAVCRLGSGRVVTMLEGGYDLQAIANSAVAHVGALLED